MRETFCDSSSFASAWFGDLKSAHVSGGRCSRSTGPGV